MTLKELLNKIESHKHVYVLYTNYRYNDKTEELEMYGKHVASNGFVNDVLKTISEDYLSSKVVKTESTNNSLVIEII